MRKSDHAKIKSTLDARCNASSDGRKQREALRKAIEFTKFELDCHGVEMNQGYATGAIVTDGQPETDVPLVRPDHHVAWRPRHDRRSRH